MADLIDMLDFGGIPSMRGGRKPAAPLSVVYVRDLGMEDLPKLIDPEQGPGAPPLVRLRNTHHHLARLLASGETIQACMAITGYSQSRISILQSDPAFKELLAFYAQETQKVYLNVHERLARFGTDALETLQERLDEAPDQFTNRELKELAEMALDRSVAPPKGQSQGQVGSAPVSVNFVVKFKEVSGGEALPLLDLTPEDPA